MHNYDYKVEAKLKRIQEFKFCPYCGDEGVSVYTGDFYGYTMCLKCDKELEFNIENRKGRKYYLD